MTKTSTRTSTATTLEDFLEGKSAHTLSIFQHFIAAFQTVGKVDILPAKTMIGIATTRKRIAYVTQLGKNFVHVVFPFETAYEENLCFQKIAQVPGDARQFNHHLRLLRNEDINAEVIRFMKLAFKQGS